MVFVIFALVLILISKALVSFDEETLIIIATIVWIDAAGGLFKSMLDSELVHKVNSIEVKFVWFLDLKRKLLLDVVSFHQTRLNLSQLLSTFHNSFVSLLLVTILNSYVNGQIIKLAHTKESYLTSFGDSVQYDKIIRGLQETISTLDYASTTVRIASAQGKRSFFAEYPVASYLKG